MAPNLQTVPNNETKHDQMPLLKRTHFITLLVTNFMLLLLMLGLLLIKINTVSDTFNIKIDAVEKRLQKDIQTLHVKFSSSVNENIIYLKIKILNTSIKHELAQKIAHYVYKYCKIYDRDPNLMLALIRIESNFDPIAVSSQGAKGLTQIMPFWKEIFRIDEDFFDIEISIKYSLQILALYEKQYDSLEMALIAYNRGNHRIESSIMLGKDPRNGYATKIMDNYTELKEMTISKQ